METLTRPSLIGHRGAAAVAPENTLAGLRAAAALGARCVEVDVRLTRDGFPVLIHDVRVDRTTDGAGAVAALTWMELRRLDAGRWFGAEFAGERVPGLEEAMSLLAELGLAAVFELKPAGGNAAALAQAVAASVRQHWPASLPAPLISSFDREAVAAAQAAAPEIGRALVVDTVPEDWRTAVDRLGCSALHADHRRLDVDIVAEVGARLPLGAYTVNAAARARQLFDWGVDAIFSDRADLIISPDGHT